MAARPSLNRKSDRPLLRADLTRYAEAHEVELIFLDPPEVFDAAILGLIYGYGQEVAVLYDEREVIEALRAGGMSAEDAEEWFEYNTLGAYLGEATPRFLTWRPEDRDA